jgi:hypothetical protein
MGHVTALKVPRLLLVHTASTLTNPKRPAAGNRFPPLAWPGTVQDYDNLPVQFNGFCPVALLSGGKSSTPVAFPAGGRFT